MSAALGHSSPGRAFPGSRSARAEMPTATTLAGD